jgi:hypothetical protein
MVMMNDLPEFANFVTHHRKTRTQKRDAVRMCHFCFHLTNFVASRQMATVLGIERAAGRRDYMAAEVFK